MKVVRGIAIAAALAALALVSVRAQSQPEPSPRNIIVITIDGLRWQEFFGGADAEYFKRDKSGSGGEPERRFWRADAVHVEHDGNEGTDLRRPQRVQRVAPHQRPLVLVSRLQRDVRRTCRSEDRHQ